MESCCIVVPCYNEAERLQSDKFRKYLSFRPNISMVFVDDGSTDGTLALLQLLRDELPRQVSVLSKAKNAGKAEAVRDGLLHALSNSGAPYVGFWDADLATPLDAIDDLLEVFSSYPQINIVFGSRVKLLGRHIERRPARHYLGRAFATCASMVLGLPIYDTQCGAKLFRATPNLREVLQSPFLSRWIFDVELIARFIRVYSAQGKDVSELTYEFPLHCWQDVPGSKLRPRDFMRAVQELLTIRRVYLRKSSPRKVHAGRKESDGKTAQPTVNG